MDRDRYSERDKILISYSYDVRDLARAIATRFEERRRSVFNPDYEILDYCDLEPAQLSASESWQDHIINPADSRLRLVICLFGRRVGTPLPATFRGHASFSTALTALGLEGVIGRDPDPARCPPWRCPTTGTVFECLSALHRARTTPDGWPHVSILVRSDSAYAIAAEADRLGRLPEPDVSEVRQRRWLVSLLHSMRGHPMVCASSDEALIAAADTA
jgi:hypothetical protein